MLRAASLLCFFIGLPVSYGLDAAGVTGASDVLVVGAVVAGVVAGVVALVRRGPHAAPIAGLVLNALFGVVILLALSRSAAPEPVWPEAMPATPTVGPVLLTHDAEFKGEGDLGGASAFLADHNHEVVVVTARHLLGEGWGIDPPIPAREVGARVVHWSVHRRQPPALGARVGALVAALDQEPVDVIVFKAEYVVAGSSVLKVRERPSAPGEVLFLVGCPYAEKDCAQNIYPLLVAEVGGSVGEMRGSWLQRSVVLAGFSGAPVVDSAGDVVGVLVNGGVPDDEGKDTGAGFVDITQLWRR